MSTCTQLCSECGIQFSIPPEETAFLEKVSPAVDGRPQLLPPPGLCPGCREQSRLVFRNEWNMYRRKCDLSGKEIISIYDSDSVYRVFDPAVWWSDEFDPLLYGKDFDFSRPFFEQMQELNLAVPKAAIQNAKSENSAYTNYSAENKNCYVCVGSANNEDCYYCSRVFDSKHVCDSYDLLRCEYCWECIHGSNLYQCVFSKNCHNSSNLIYCEDCRGCRDCLGCAELRNKSFCLFNKELSEEEYRQAAAAWQTRLGSKELFAARIRSKRKTYNVNCEDCTGEQLVNCSRCRACFSLKESQDCRYVGSGTDDRDCWDCNFMDNSELLYYSTNLRHNYRVLFCAKVWYSNETLYSLNCYNSSNLFGCSGMKRNSYCILNKQYDREHYEKLASRIISHMEETGEWGKFFPAHLSPFPYNCTVANEYYPLTKDEVHAKGLSWHTEDEPEKKSGPSEPGCSGVLNCAVTGKAFKLTKQEKDLCELLQVPAPAKSPAVRQQERMKDIKRAISCYT